MEPTFHRLASQEYLSAFRWYARRSIRVAARFLQAVDKAIQDIAANPQLWPKYDDRFR